MNPARKTRLLAAIVFAFSTHPSPAPIFEKKPATPKPTSPKPKPKPAAKPKSSSPPPVAPAKRSRFAGTWVGTIQSFPTGNIPVVLTVDATESKMTMKWANEKPAPGKPTIAGETMQSSFPGPFGAQKWTTWSLTPQADGATAIVRMQAFMNDFSAVFHRTVK